jgi:hypothetical protein
MSLSTDVMMNLLLNVDNGARIADELENMVGGATTKGLSKAIQESQKEIGKKFTAAIVGAHRLGHKKAAQNLVDLYKDSQRNIQRMAKEQRKLEKKLRKTEHEGDRKHLIEQIRLKKKALADELNAIEKATDKLADAQAERLEMLDAGMQRTATSFSKRLEEGGTKFGDLMESAMSIDNFDFAGFTRGLGASFKDAAPAMMAKGQSLRAAGGGAGVLGKALVSLSASAGVIAGAAAALAGFIAVLTAAYGQTKAFNAAILEGSSAVDHLASDALGSSLDLADALGNTRRSAMLLAYNFRMGTEEVLAMGTAMNDVGLTFREQQKVFGHQALAMRQMIIATQSLGIASGEAADMINRMSRDFAFGQSEIAGGFEDIFGASQMSGMGVKNFFTAVSQATSGMALYNFRLEDTLELLVGMEKILGEEMGGQVLQGLTGKYKELGFTDRMQKTMVAGSAGRSVLEATAKRITEGITGRQAEALRAAGATFTDGKLDLSGTTGTALGRLQNAIEDDFPALADKLSGLAQLQRGARGKATLGQRAGAVGELDQLGTLAFDMVSAFGVLGNKTLGEMEGLDRAAFEQITGISGTMFESYQDIANRIGAQLEDQTGKPATMKAIGEAIAQGDILSEKDKKKLEEAQMAGMSVMEKLADQQLKETRSVVDTLKNGVVMILETIYETLINIPLVGGGVSVRAAREKSQAAEAELQRVRELTGDTPSREGSTVRGLRLTAEFEKRAYEGAMQGKSRVQVLRELSESSGYTPTKTITSSGNRHGSYVGPDLEVDKQASEFTEDDIVAMMGAEEEAEKQRAKDAKKQLDTSKKAERAVTEMNEREKRAALESLVGMEATDENRLKILAKLNEDNVIDAAERLAFNRAYPNAQIGRSVDDFVYRGGRNGGIITPIDRAEDFLAMKPGGAVEKAMGGRSVVINNLTINESGDPMKTVKMVNMAIDARNGVA